jgi:hypothetical protein
MKIKLTISIESSSFTKMPVPFEGVTKITTSSPIYAMNNDTGELEYYFSERKFNNFRKRMDIKFEN